MMIMRRKWWGEEESRNLEEAEGRVKDDNENVEYGTFR